MAISKPLVGLMGAGATQDIDSFTILKASLKSNRVPIAFQALVPLAENTPESLFAALLLLVWEGQDTSPDAELAIFGPDVQLVQIISDGVPAVHDQFVFSVRILVKRPTSQVMPNPNVI
jgi:hypothetical protein